MMNALNAYLTLAQIKLREFFTNEEGDVNIVSIVVLIGIAVLLAVVFKNSITNLINQMLGAITTNALGAVGGGE